MQSFFASKKIGDTAENAIVRLFTKMGFECTKNKIRKEFSYYDILCRSGNSELKVEVKNDVKATKTGNMCIEYYNPRSQKSSGVGITQADVWAHVIGSQALLFKVPMLKKMLEDVPPFRNIMLGGDDNSRFYLYRIESVLPYASANIDLEDNAITSEFSQKIKNEFFS